VSALAAESPPLAPTPFRVVDRETETKDTVTLALEPTRVGPAFSFAPGQFNMVSVLGTGEVAISISGDPSIPGGVVHTVRSLGLATQTLAQSTKGAILAVRGPYGRGWPLSSAQGHDLVVVAGGLGLAPLRPLLYAVLADRAKYGRLEVVYGARTPQDLVYYRELQAWRARPDARFQVTVDAAGRDWYGDVGVVTQRLPDCRFDPRRTTAFVCGPEIMMRLTAEALEARGVPAEAIWISFERNMHCGIGQCGHCQLGPYLLCRDGPVLPYRDVRSLLRVREL
jgi:NAD(P)H-flavin reductase